ncbi:MAG: ParB/RepB/Spo0J family partition protein [Nitrospira sp.]|nr:ParB/RepB/Spo0J family partition protein [Nitrospira sp.]
MFEKLGGGVYGMFGKALPANAVGGGPQLPQSAMPASQAMPEPEPAPAPEPEPELREVELDRIVVEERIRKPKPGHEELKASIMVFGILVPLLIERIKGDNARFKLIDGVARLSIARDLGHKAVPVKVVDLERAIDGEIDSNVLRQQFTVSEMVCIGLMIESKLGERRGRPKKDESGKPNRLSDQVAWKRAGFGNQETYRQAKAVVDIGDADLIAQMDNEELSINAAYQLMKSKQADEQPTSSEPNAEGEADGDAPESQSSTSNGKKRSAGPFAPSRSPKPTTTAPTDGTDSDGMDAEIKSAKILPSIRALLEEHGALNLLPKVEASEVGHVLVLPKENTRLTLIVAALEIENLNQLIDKSKLFVTFAK